MVKRKNRTLTEEMVISSVNISRKNKDFLEREGYNRSKVVNNFLTKKRKGLL